MKKFLIICLCLLILSFCFPFSAFCATSGTYEYNDFNLYSTGGTAYASGALRSDNSGLTSFRIAVNVNTNQWWITDGSWTNIPFPTGITIDFTNNTTFLTTAYITANGNTYNFTIISGSDSSGIFYSQLIPASPYYPTVNVYLPTEGTATIVPSTPVITYSDGYITWNTQFSAGQSMEVYRSDSQALAGTLLSSNLTGSGYKIRDGQDGYYYCRVRYYVNGVANYTDYSNRVYGEYIADPVIDPDNPDTWVDKLIDILEGLHTASDTVKQFINESGDLFTQIFSWLPAPILAVFTAIIIIGLVLGLFLK